MTAARDSLDSRAELIVMIEPPLPASIIGGTTGIRRSQAVAVGLGIWAAGVHNAPDASGSDGAGGSCGGGTSCGGGGGGCGGGSGC